MDQCADLYVGKSLIPHAGQGLFTTRARKAGESIVRMESPHDVESVEGVDAQGRPFDSVVHVYNSKRIIADLAFCGDEVPLWYRMNHSNRPNTCMKLEGAGVVWKALRKIEPDSELCYQYEKGLDF